MIREPLVLYFDEFDAASADDVKTHYDLAEWAEWEDWATVPVKLAVTKYTAADLMGHIAPAKPLTEWQTLCNTLQDDIINRMILPVPYTPARVPRNKYKRHLRR